MVSIHLLLSLDSGISLTESAYWYMLQNNSEFLALILESK
jgi:hypothetical protein